MFPADVFCMGSDFCFPGSQQGQVDVVSLYFWLCYRCKLYAKTQLVAFPIAR